MGVTVVGANGRPVSSNLVDAGVFSVAFEEHFQSVHRFLARRVGTILADDLAAETFATAFSRRTSFDSSRGSAKGWFFGIATNVLRNHWRVEQRLFALDARPGRDRTTGAYEVTDALAGTWELGPQVAKALGELTQDHRDVLLLHAWADLTYEEIAFALELPMGTVRSRLS